MTTSVIEGSTSYHDYSFVDADGAAITSVEGLEYKLSSKFGTLIDWTAITDLTPPGTLEISGTMNTKSKKADSLRYLTFRATHNGGNIITCEDTYSLTDLVGIIPSV